MEKEISDGIKKIPDPKEQLLVRLLIGFILAIGPLFLWSKQSELNASKEETKNRDQTIYLLRKKLIVSDSLYNDCGKQRLIDAVKTLERLQRNLDINDSIKNLIRKIK